MPTAVPLFLVAPSQTVLEIQLTVATGIPLPPTQLNHLHLSPMILPKLEMIVIVTVVVTQLG
jgi:hypothetical protein